MEREREMFNTESIHISHIRTFLKNIFFRVCICTHTDICDEEQIQQTRSRTHIGPSSRFLRVT